MISKTGIQRKTRPTNDPKKKNFKDMLVLKIINLWKTWQLIFKKSSLLTTIFRMESILVNRFFFVTGHFLQNWKMCCPKVLPIYTTCLCKPPYKLMTLSSMECLNFFLHSKPKYFMSIVVIETETVKWWSEKELIFLCELGFFPRCFFPLCLDDCSSIILFKFPKNFERKIV